MTDFTKDEAREALVQIMAEALDDCGEINLNPDELEEAANYAAEAAWSAAPTVAIAAGGHVMPDHEWHWEDGHDAQRRTSLHITLPGQWETAGAREDIEQAIGPRILDAVRQAREEGDQ